MKKIIIALLLITGSALFLINYLANITGIETDKVKTNALNQLIATENKPEPSKESPKIEDKRAGIIEQITNSITPAVKHATETAIPTLNTTENNTEAPKQTNTKPPMATIKIYDRKTAKETIIETPELLETEQKKLNPEQQKKLQDKTAKFRVYYQKPEKCLSPATKEIRVQCANEYMRAKAKFEELYQQGKL